MMTRKPHAEKHFNATDTVRDIVIGMSDGLTVPFALAAGLTGAISASGLIVTAGLAEIAAGSIAMGLGGYLAARGDADHYDSERRPYSSFSQALPSPCPGFGGLLCPLLSRKVATQRPHLWLQGHLSS